MTQTSMDARVTIEFVQYTVREIQEEHEIRIGFNSLVDQQREYVTLNFVTP